MPIADAPRTLRALMAARGLYRATQLAARCGVTSSQISLIENGWRGTPAIRAKIAKALGVRAGDVLAAAKAAHEVAS